MSKTSFSVAQARDLIIAVAAVSALDTRPMIFPKVQLLDAGSLTLLANTFGVATGEDPDVYDNSITDAIMEVFSAARYTTPVFVRPTLSMDTMDLRSLGVSLRDENVADDAARAVAAALATNRGMFRLTIKALQRRQLLPKVFIPAATLPARALL